MPANSKVYFNIYDRDLFSAEKIGEASLAVSTNGQRYTFIRTYVCIYAYVCTSLSLSLSLSVCVCVCVCVYTFLHSRAHTHAHAHSRRHACLHSICTLTYIRVRADPTAPPQASAGFRCAEAARMRARAICSCI